MNGTVRSGRELWRRATRTLSLPRFSENTILLAFGLAAGVLSALGVVFVHTLMDRPGEFRYAHEDVIIGCARHP